MSYQQASRRNLLRVGSHQPEDPRSCGLLPVHRPWRRRVEQVIRLQFPAAPERWPQPDEDCFRYELGSQVWIAPRSDRSR